MHNFWKTQVSVDSVGNGSNLNYRCLVVCSWFLEKIIFWYTTTYFIGDTPRVSQYSTPSYERSCPPSWLFYEIGIENSKKFKKNQNDVRPSRGFIIYVLVSIKNNKLGIQQLYKKWVHRNELSSTKIHVFRSKWRVLWPHPWHSLFICAHILQKHASWKHGQCWRRKFSFSLDKKPFSIFRVKNGFFCKAPTTNMLQKLRNTFFENTRPCYMNK